MSNSQMSQPPFAAPPPLPREVVAELFMVFYVAPGICECWKDVPAKQANEIVQRLSKTVLGATICAVGSRGTMIDRENPYAE